MRTVTVRGVELGAGAPKVIVPLTGTHDAELLEQVAHVLPAAPDVVEWRVDFHVDATDVDAVVASAAVLRQALGDVPLLATFRTADEGGERAVDAATYARLNAALAASGHVDLVDVEIFRDADAVDAVVAAAHAHDVAVVASNHDFHATPTQEEIVRRLVHMDERGADVLKIAVMPRTPADVLTLLAATWEVRSTRTDKPLVTMSMGGTGVVTRLAGETFGSAATFGMVGRASAPGQVEVGALRQVLDTVHGAR